MHCSECNDAPNGIPDFELDYSSGTYVCRKCGAVQEEQVIDTGKDWRYFEEENKSVDQARAEKFEEDFHSLDTLIAPNNFGSNVPSSTSKNLTLISKMADNTEENRTRHQLKRAFSRVGLFAELLQLNGVIEDTAKEILKQFDQMRSKYMKGCRSDAFFVAVLLLACRQQHQGGRTLKEVARITNLDERDVKRFFRILLRENPNGRFSFSCLLDNNRNAPYNISCNRNRMESSFQVRELVEVFCSKLHLSLSYRKQAKEIASKVSPFLEGRRPSSIAAAVILFVLNGTYGKHRQRDIIRVSGVSPNTLRSVYRELCEHIDALFDLKEKSDQQTPLLHIHSS
jgi:transcription initiation factor TFIIB